MSKSLILPSFMFASLSCICYTACVALAVNLAYKLKLYPTRNKADTLALLAALFRKSHADATHQLAQEQGRPPSTKGMGDFIGRAYRRAYKDYHRAHKAGHEAGILKAELIDAADVQEPRKARSFDLWVLIRGTTICQGGKGGFYLPAKKHRGINRTLALPGAILNESAEVFRSLRGHWYVRVSVSVPLAEIQIPNGWLGCDVGLRTSVARSDGYMGPDLRPIIKRTIQRKADQQRNGIDRQTVTCQRHVIAREARKAVTVCQRSGRGLVVEDPRRLPRYKQWAARYFALRAQLLMAIIGLPVFLTPPPRTSITCSRCGWVEKGQRHKETFRCWRCGYIRNADRNASQVIRRRAHGYCHSQQSLPSPPSGGVEVDG